MTSLLRLEGLALGIAGIAAFWWLGESWWLFAVLFLAPDCSFAAYRAGPKVGARVYNAFHTWLAPVLVAVPGALFGSSLVLSVAAIWAAHIGIDRALGYGLKYETGFTDTHLGPIGGGGVDKSVGRD